MSSRLKLNSPVASRTATFVDIEASDMYFTEISIIRRGKGGKRLEVNLEWRYVIPADSDTPERVIGGGRDELEDDDARLFLQQAGSGANIGKRLTSIAHKYLKVKGTLPDAEIVEE